MVRSASARVSFWSGSKPPGGCPSALARVTVAWKFWIGETSSTGASVPFSDPRPAVEELAPDVGALGHARVAEPLRRPGPVGGTVDALHRGQHAEPAEARDVRGVEDLGVLDAEARVLHLGPLGERLLVDVEHHAVRPVADRVDRRPGSRGRARSARPPASPRAASRSRPRLPGSSAYGSSSAAPREPRAPSA